MPTTLFRAPRRLALVAAAVAALALPAASQAATISYDGSGALTYQGAPGEKNYFNYGLYDDGTFYVSDSGAASLNYPAGTCVAGYVFYVLICDKPTAVTASLGDMDDIADGDKSVPFTADGGPGKDTLRGDIQSTATVNLSGGPDNDRITGGKGPDVLNGGDGVDEINGRDAGDTINGGAGDDKLTLDGYNISPAADVADGGPGFDTIESEWTETSDSRDPLTITLGGGADDGRPGEGDDLRSVEHLHLTISGNYTGSENADNIDINQVETPSTLRGLGGDDHLEAADADDEIDGGPGNDSLDGGYGHDHIVGGPGKDVIHGDTQGGECSYLYCKPAFGNDVIDARDGEVDNIDCGVGTDRVVADAADVVSTDCETVERGGTAAGGNNGDGNGGNNGGGDGGNGGGQTELSVLFTKTSLKKALKNGVKVRFSGPGAGTLQLLALKGSKAVASGSGKIAASGKGTVTLKFTKAGQKALKKAKSAKLTVRLAWTPTGGTPVEGQTKITLKR